IADSSSDYDKSKVIMGKVYSGTPTLLMNFGAVFKHRSFREENEWRIALSTTTRASHLDSVGFREADGVPFLKIPLSLKDQNCPLKRIVVGPSSSKEQSASILEINLKQMGIQNIEVAPSKIPYRNW
ncbi:MAG: hypothetical protein WAK26_09575, partial [Terracidiphilus sp.]